MVIVDSSYSRLANRKALATEIGGHVNLSILSLDELASGVANLENKNILSALAQRELIEQAARAASNSIAQVAEHPESLDSLCELVSETQLFQIDPQNIAKLPNGKELAKVITEYERLRGDALDRAGMLKTAIEHPDPKRIKELGEVIYYLPTDLSPLEAQFIESLPNVQIIPGLTGVPELDPPDTQTELPQQTFTKIQAPNRDTEVRHAIRTTIEWIAADIPVHRIAILTAQPTIYLRALTEAAQRVGLAFSAPSSSDLKDTPTGRFANALIELANSSFSRPQLIKLLNSAALKHNGRTVPADTWSALIHQSHWFATYKDAIAALQTLQTQLESHKPNTNGSDAENYEIILEATKQELEELESFITQVHAVTTRQHKTWTDWSRWLIEAITTFTQTPSAKDTKKTKDHQAVLKAITELGTLDGLNTPATHTEVKRVLSHQLDQRAPSEGKLGTGIFIGKLADAIGCEFDRVIVIGAHEGELPARNTALAFISERQRETLGLPVRTTNDQWRELLLAIGNTSEVVLSCAAVDEINQQPLRTSRWWNTPRPDAHSETITIASAQHAELEAGVPATPHEYVLRKIAAAEPLTHPLVGGTLARSLRAATLRVKGGFHEYSGLIGPHTLLAQLTPSATGLEKYAACPRQYFFEKVLRVTEPRVVEPLERITPMDKGSLIHEILEEFIGSHAPTDPTYQWSTHDAETLHKIASAHFASVEAAGISGHDFWWNIEKERIHGLLDEFLEVDTDLRSSLGVVPVEAELAFGYENSTVEAGRFDLGSRTLYVHGHIDRVDRSPDGTILGVFDYKTGRDDKYRKLSDDVTARGTLLQLPLYAQAVAQHYGVDNVIAAYWMVSNRASADQYPMLLDEPARARIHNVLETIDEGLSSGVFPAHPGNSTWRAWTGDTWEVCMTCQYNDVCPVDRDREWEHVATDPRIASYLELSEGELPNPDTPG